MSKQSEKITALYYRLSHDDEQEGASGSIKNQQSIARPAFTEIMELAEKGLIGTLIVKDHSRLGRNRLVVGQLLEEGFEVWA